MSDSFPVALILAAGLSRRMGRPKTWVDIGGRPAIERIVSSCRAAGMDRICIVAGSDHPEISARLELDAADVVHNPEPERGQTLSIRLGVERVGEVDLCLFPVDHAFVRLETVDELCRSFRERAEEIEIVVPSCEGRRGHPAFFSARVAREFARLGENDPAHLVVRRSSSRVDHHLVSDAAIYLDFDTPEDLERLRNK